MIGLCCDSGAQLPNVGAHTGPGLPARCTTAFL